MDDEYANTAYDITVSDAVPAGVKVIAETGSPSDGGIVSDDGRKVTWTLASLDKNTSKTFSFKARLQPTDPELTATDVQNNVATIDRYYSWPGAQSGRSTEPGHSRVRSTQRQRDGNPGAAGVEHHEDGYVRTTGIHRRAVHVDHGHLERLGGHRVQLRRQRHDADELGLRDR